MEGSQEIENRLELLTCRATDMIMHLLRMLWIDYGDDQTKILYIIRPSSLFGFSPERILRFLTSARGSRGVDLGFRRHVNRGRPWRVTRSGGGCSRSRPVGAVARATGSKQCSPDDEMGRRRRRLGSLRRRKGVVCASKATPWWLFCRASISDFFWPGAQRSDIFCVDTVLLSFFVFLKMCIFL